MDPTFSFELHPSKNVMLKSYLSDEIDYTFDEHTDWGEKEFLELTEVLAKYYDADTDSCRITANVTEVELEPKETSTVDDD